MTVTAILLDTREPTWVKELKFGGIPTSVTMLEVGDAMLATDDGKLILIERKQPDDLLNSIRDGRLFNQAADMLLQTRWSYVVITGQLTTNHAGQVITDRGETGWSFGSIQGALLTLQELGIFVYFCEDALAYEETVLKIGSRERKKDLLLLPVKYPRYLSPGEQILANLPGIGEERLNILLSQCDSIAWALACLTDSTSEIKGIPNNVKAKVRATLKLRDADQLAVITNEAGDEILSIQQAGSQ